LNSPTVIHEPELSTAHENGGAISSQVSVRLRQGHLVFQYNPNERQRL